jgi:hypothetical protein
MKKQILLLLAAAFVFQLQAQKLKLSGDLGMLKGEKVFDITFTYDHLKVGKMSEEQYMSKKMKEADEDEPGKGEKWKEMWYEDRTSHYEPKFTELLNDYVKKAGVVFEPNAEGAKYELVVHTTFIEPGFNIGITRKDASIDMEVSFVPVDDESNVLNTITISRSPGRTGMGYGDFDLGVRVGEAYAKAGKELGKFLTKKAF